jgi:hypothetical protein
VGHLLPATLLIVVASAISPHAQGFMSFTPAPVVANLSLQDMIAIAAYVSSRSPESSRPATTARRE